MTDTYNDHNGVSMVLQAMYEEIRKRDLPIDIMVCSNTLQSDEHLIVVKPISEFNLPLYRHQPLRIPNLITIQRIFRKRKYDRIICSTEGPMGLAALYLKKIYPAKTYFYLHTDWLMFAKQVMEMETVGLTRLERVMRIFYNRFDRIFVLNSDQQRWLTSSTMRFEPSRVRITAHWADKIFTNHERVETPMKEHKDQVPVILFAGRLSKEKGIFELPGIYRNASDRIPGLRMIIAGTGPAEIELKNAFPEAKFTGWIDHDRLPEIYAAAGLLVLTSRFDTFSCVVLESMSSGLPVIAYNTKGPKDIIRDGIDGFLVDTPGEMSEKIVQFFSDQHLQVSFRQAAMERAEDYSADSIIEQLLQDIELKATVLTDGTSED